VIVVEGPDGGGKTTLINHLLDDFPQYGVAPRVVAKDTTSMVDLKQWVEDDNNAPGRGIMYDRHRLISEPIYGPIMRPNQPEPGFDNLNWFLNQTKVFYNRRPIIIYCLPRLEVVRANVSEDPNNKEVADKITPIWQGYMVRAACDWPGRALIYDYQKNSYRQLTLNIKILMTEREFYW
jgi:GTPase SAR1 family protein